jgi:hypothetical protein
MSEQQGEPEEGTVEQPEEPDTEQVETEDEQAAAGGEEPPEGTVDEVLEWVGGDPEKAQRALDAENESDSPRSTLVTQLEGLAGE